jgi:AhpD family alkylhydroperoxidase
LHRRGIEASLQIWSIRSSQINGCAGLMHVRDARKAREVASACITAERLGRGADPPARSAGDG